MNTNGLHLPERIDENATVVLRVREREYGRAGLADTEWNAQWRIEAPSAGGPPEGQQAKKAA
jgi:hypothetical protein